MQQCDRNGHNANLREYVNKRRANARASYYKLTVIKQKFFAFAELVINRKN